MPWQVTATQNEEAWFDDYCRQVISTAPPPLPPNNQIFDHVESFWYEVEPGVAYVAANGGTFDDRRLIEAVVRAQLEPYGYQPPRISMLLPPVGTERRSDWDEVSNKAKRLIQSGQVQILRNGSDKIVAKVVGDHGTYQPEIDREDPASQSISGSRCQCDWGNFQNTPRTRQWQRFQDRPCAHILAAYWQALATPLDDGEQMGLPGTSGPSSAPGSMGLMKGQQPGLAPFRMSPATPSGQVGPEQMSLMPPGGGGPQEGAGGAPGPSQPSPAEVLPQFPGPPPPPAPAANPASIPGLRKPSPMDPIQYPGGTFSSWRPARMQRMAVEQTYQNGDIVQLLNDDMGTWVGRSEEHGAGQPAPLKAGPQQLGTVLGTHPSTGMVNVYYTRPAQDHGELEPHGAVAWHWPSDIKARPDVRQPGPAIARPRGVH